LNFGFHRLDCGNSFVNFFQPLYFLKRSSGEPDFHWDDPFIIIYIPLFLPPLLWMNQGKEFLVKSAQYFIRVSYE